VTFFVEGTFLDVGNVRILLRVLVGRAFGMPLIRVADFFVFLVSLGVRALGVAPVLVDFDCLGHGLQSRL
jgi:hypothetical protein